MTKRAAKLETLNQGALSEGGVQTAARKVGLITACYGLAELLEAISVSLFWTALAVTVCSLSNDPIYRKRGYFVSGNLSGKLSIHNAGSTQNRRHDIDQYPDIGKNCIRRCISDYIIILSFKYGSLSNTNEAPSMLQLHIRKTTKQHR